jgi:hypothetical protein
MPPWLATTGGISVGISVLSRKRRHRAIPLNSQLPESPKARKYATELVALGPDVILASGDHSVVASQQATRTVPIVFTLVSDPVGTGYVESLARPRARFGTLRARVRASWGLSGWRGNERIGNVTFCREAPDGLSLAQFQPSPWRARTGRKTPAARRNGWLVARAYFWRKSR